MANRLHILLADDDRDDDMLFRDVLKEIPLATDLKTLPNGDQLMQQLQKTNAEFPDVIFLDLNMPRKNGFDCLREIKKEKKLKDIPVVIFSISGEKDIINRMYENGARYYIRKPNTYEELKTLIYKALILISEKNSTLPREEFVLSTEIPGNVHQT